MVYNPIQGIKQAASYILNGPKGDISRSYNGVKGNGLRDTTLYDLVNSDGLPPTVTEGVVQSGWTLATAGLGALATIGVAATGIGFAGILATALGIGAINYAGIKYVGEENQNKLQDRRDQRSEEQARKRHRAQAKSFSLKIKENLEQLATERNEYLIQDTKQQLNKLKKLYAEHNGHLATNAERCIAQYTRLLGEYTKPKEAPSEREVPTQTVIQPRGSYPDIALEPEHPRTEMEVASLLGLATIPEGYTVRDLLGDFERAKRRNTNDKGEPVQGRTIEELLQEDGAAKFKEALPTGMQYDPKKSGGKVFKTLEALYQLDNPERAVRVFAETRENYRGDKERHIRSVLGVLTGEGVNLEYELTQSGVGVSMHTADIYRVLEALTPYLVSVSADETVVDKPVTIPGGVGPKGDTHGYQEDGRKAPTEEERYLEERVKRGTGKFDLAMIKDAQEIAAEMQGLTFAEKRDLFERDVSQAIAYTWGTEYEGETRYDPGEANSILTRAKHRIQHLEGPLQVGATKRVNAGMAAAGAHKNANLVIPPQPKSENIAVLTRSIVDKVNSLYVGDSQLVHSDVLDLIMEVIPTPYVGSFVDSLEDREVHTEQDGALSREFSEGSSSALDDFFGSD